MLDRQEARGPQWKDLVLTNREFDVYKLQTIIFSLAVAVALVVGGASDLATFAIPSAMLGVLGLSQVVFVGGILVRPPATEDLDKTLSELRDAASKYTKALARNTDVDSDGKLLHTIPAGQPVAANAKRRYEQLVEKAIPMIESTLEIEVNKDSLLDAPSPLKEKERRKELRKRWDTTKKAMGDMTQPAPLMTAESVRALTRWWEFHRRARARARAQRRTAPRS